MPDRLVVLLLFFLLHWIVSILLQRIALVCCGIPNSGVFVFLYGKMCKPLLPVVVVFFFYWNTLMLCIFCFCDDLFLGLVIFFLLRRWQEALITASSACLSVRINCRKGLFFLCVCDLNHIFSLSLFSLWSWVHKEAVCVCEGHIQVWVHSLWPSFPR